LKKSRCDKRLLKAPEDYMEVSGLQAQAAALRNTPAAAAAATYTTVW
jgi:hypothetical protein